MVYHLKTIALTTFPDSWLKNSFRDRVSSRSWTRWCPEILQPHIASRSFCDVWSFQLILFIIPPIKGYVIAKNYTPCSLVVFAFSVAPLQSGSIAHCTRLECIGVCTLHEWLVRIFHCNWAHMESRTWCWCTTIQKRSPQHRSTYFCDYNYYYVAASSWGPVHNCYIANSAYNTAFSLT